MAEPSTRPDHWYCVQFESCSHACWQPSSLVNMPRNGICDAQHGATSTCERTHGYVLVS